MSGSKSPSSITPLTQEEFNRVKAKESEYFDGSSASRRKQLDNEAGSGSFGFSLGIAGFVSTFFMKDAYRHGWESELNRQSGAREEIKHKDPSNTVMATAIAANIVILSIIAAIFIAPALPFAAAAAYGIAVAGAAVVGVLLGIVDGWLENGKIKDSVERGKLKVKEVIGDVRAEVKAEQQAQQITELQSQVKQLSANRTPPPFEQHIANQRAASADASKAAGDL